MVGTQGYARSPFSKREAQSSGSPPKYQCFDRRSALSDRQCTNGEAVGEARRPRGIVVLGLPELSKVSRNAGPLKMERGSRMG